MFKKVLIPTDGSSLSVQAANAGIIFARSVGAEVVAVHVTQPLAATVGFDGLASAYAFTGDDYDNVMTQQSSQYLQHILDRAKAAGIEASSLTINTVNIAEGIVQAAEEAGCDLVFISSHGRSGLSRLLLGSVTASVLSLAHVAVLVYRVKEEK
jgi:nucleotide-binding universal stress UspA family protein